MNNKQERRLIRVIRNMAVCLCVAWAGFANAETVYVTDMLQLELYETKEMTGPPLKRLRSGDSMEVLKQESSYARVRLPDGETGWVKSLYLVDKEPARTRVNKLEAEIEKAQNTIGELEQQLGERESRLASIEASQEGSRELEEAVQAELETLRVENEDMQSRLNAYVDNVPISWLLISLVVALAAGFTGGWYYIDRRSRAKHGGYRVY